MKRCITIVLLCAVITSAGFAGAVSALVSTTNTYIITNAVVATTNVVTSTNAYYSIGGLRVSGGSNAYVGLYEVFGPSWRKVTDPNIILTNSADLATWALSEDAGTGIVGTNVGSVSVATSVTNVKYIMLDIGNNELITAMSFVMLTNACYTNTTSYVITQIYTNTWSLSNTWWTTNFIIGITNDMDAVRYAGQKILGGQTNLLSWSIDYEPSAIWFTAVSGPIWIAPTLKPKLLFCNVLSNDGVHVGYTVTTTNNLFTRVTDPDILYATLRGRQSLWITSTNAVSVTNTFDVEITK